MNKFGPPFALPKGLQVDPRTLEEPIKQDLASTYVAVFNSIVLSTLIRRSIPEENREGFFQEITKQCENAQDKIWRQAAPQILNLGIDTLHIFKEFSQTCDSLMRSVKNGVENPPYMPESEDTE